MTEKTKPAAKPKTTATVLSIKDLAKRLDVEPATARMKLRKAGLKPKGKAWFWPSNKELEATAKKLEAA